jgi:transcriptional regulator with XRE-family HTH domain
MSRKPDRFQITRELARRLRDLRERAGLTQAELARLAGTDWDQALVSRLETFEHSNPTLGLVADYLRTCRASFADLADLLNAYTSKPRPVEQRGRRACHNTTAGQTRSEAQAA